MPRTVSSHRDDSLISSPYGSFSARPGERGLGKIAVFSTLPRPFSSEIRSARIIRKGQKKWSRERETTTTTFSVCSSVTAQDSLLALFYPSPALISGK